MKTQKQAKQEAYDYFSKMTKEERLSRACWSEPFFNLKPSDKHGNLFWGNARIWIDREGNIYNNKPKN